MSAHLHPLQAFALPPGQLPPVAIPGTTLPMPAPIRPADPRSGFARQIAHARRIVTDPAERAGRPHILTIAQAVLKSAGAA
ncbi:hypothetical protein SAMN04488103_109169 [Gemmobacter aquatilis]|uniref:Uncharacterized protein n=1 Tax=Gemmobacter aquatilis TaxID=933059 RepID=A0A1H8KQ87_9RHOB|nr:hypothetical protein [Gemmobacter aquatilis]SEN95073.1 hypothetical protein SAMN04488103_109169 [Gemmobacter aquatilis]